MKVTNTSMYGRMCIMRIKYDYLNTYFYKKDVHSAHVKSFNILESTFLTEFKFIYLSDL